MDSAFNSTFPYRIGGGSLGVTDPTYIERFADWEIYKKLINREYCYVLNSRQMGKSSLRVRTMYKLEQAGMSCAYIDLSGIGEKNTTPERWYRDLIEALARGFQLKLNRRTWWKENNDLSLKWRFRKFVEDAILENIAQNIVIFIDEIDSVLRFDFSADDFFSSIRSFYNNRAIHPAYRRLTFTLLGVAKPHDLIQDKRLPPFNIGCAIELQGFQLNECGVLARGFVGKADCPRQVLKEVLKWTGGQPFLTQKLCWIVATFSPYIATGREEQIVRQLARSHIIDNWEAQDDPTHLKPIRDRVLNDPQQTKVLLQLYRKVLRRGEVAARDRPEEIDLQLSGLTIAQNRKIKVYNRIYKSVFNEQWICQQLDNFPTHSPQISLFRMGVISIAVAILVMGMRLLGLLQLLELAAFDKQMQLRPTELPDERLLIVTITKDDIQKLRDRYPISDELMVRLLKKLNESKPSAIGIDIYRDPTNRETRTNLFRFLQRNPHNFSICVYPSGTKSGIEPPSHLLEHQIGFINAVRDSSNVIRRHLLAAKSRDSSICPADYSLSSLLAIHYLETQGYPLKFPSQNLDRWQFGTASFELLKPHKGFYQNARKLAGHQILLNYRATSSFEEIAQQVSITEVLRDRVNPNLIRNRIVLLGVTDSLWAKDEFNTPYSREIRGLILQAHFTSQLIAFVEDGRPLFHFFPLGIDFLLVMLGSGIGGILILRLPGTPLKVMVSCTCPILLSAISYVFLVNTGLCLPLIPSALAFTLTAVVVSALLIHEKN
ncbi:MAG: CHASE2 domain-containing protein [Cyanobacteriota bacterium]|nr:CHASE2 domain-containing protein [Cyanobacteriota bacterium]